MIVLDTNVLSEPLRPRPDAGVVAWLSDLDDEAAITAISVGELLAGVRALPEGRRRSGLLDAVGTALATFAASVLAYDAGAARRYAEIRDLRRRAGRPLSVEDGMIAAICLEHGAALATRNAADFAGLGLEVVDPWG